MFAVAVRFQTIMARLEESRSLWPKASFELEPRYDHFREVFVASTNENELKKALLGILIAGDTVIVVDNIAKPVDSAALCAIFAAHLAGVLATAPAAAVPDVIEPKAAAVNS